MLKRFFVFLTVQDLVQLDPVWKTIAVSWELDNPRAYYVATRGGLSQRKALQ